MSPRLRNTALALAALVGCKGPRSADPEPGPPEAELQPAFDPAALADGGPPAPPPLAPLAVLDYGPQGRTEGGADIRIRFNQPVVALGSEQMPGLDGLLTIEPPLAGRLEFQTPDLLVFRPDGSFLPAQTYKVKFAGGFTSPFGPKLAQGLEWTFETPRPKASGALPQGETDVRRDSAVIVEFDHPTSLAEVRAHLQASARPLRREEDPARPVALRVQELTRAEAERLDLYYYDGDERGRRFTVRAQGLWPAASRITVSVTPGLKGLLGPLPLDTPWDMSFQTYEGQAVEFAGCAPSGSCGLEPIALRLRNPVREREAAKISISPRPRHLSVEIVDAWGDAGGREVLIQGQFVPGTKYTVRVAPGLKDIYGQTLSGGFAREVAFERRPALALSSERGTLIPTRKQTIGVETRFVQELRVRWAVIDELLLAEQPWDRLSLPANARSRSIALRPEGPGGWSSVALDLAELTGGARGAVLVQVEPAVLAPNADGSAPESQRGLYRLTDLGPVAVTSLPRAAVQVLRLSDSAPVVGARVSRAEPGPKGMSLKPLGVTGDAGLLEFTPTPAPESGAVRLETLIVDDPATGDRTALATGAPVPGDSGDDVLRPGERLITRIVADRGAYRPGERVKVVGWSAIDTPFARSGLGRLPKGTEVTFTLIDPFGAQVATRKATTTAEGKYWAELPIPGEGKLGRYVVKAALVGGEVTQQVKVEDYRVPEFSVTASVKQRDLLTGERPTVRVAANYYFGGAVPISRLALQTTCWPDRYRPPGLDGTWAVGEAADHRRVRMGSSPRSFAVPRPEDRPGLMELPTATAHVGDDAPHRCTISAEVMDASMQAIGAETGVQLHPAPFYLAIGVPQGRKQVGDRAAVPLRAVEIAGARTAASGAKLVVERTWSEVQEKEEGGRKVFAGYVSKTEAIKTCTLELAASGDDARCELPPLKEGMYTLRASVGAGAGREARSAGSFWVARASRHRWIASTPTPYLDVTASATKVTPGEAVDIAVQAPWKGGRGLLVLDRQGIREVRPFEIGDGPSSFRLETDDSWTPTVHVHAFAVAPMASTRLKERPEVQSDEVVIDQDAEHRRLQVRVEAPAKAGPGDRIELAATVRDGAGAPVGGRVALWAVDEAVLALTDYEVPDLLPSFLPSRDAGARAFDDYRAVMMPYLPVGADPWMSDSWGYGRGYGSGMGGRTSNPVSLRGGAAVVTPPARERFETTPIFLADLAVDAKGEARVKATLPDNLTTFRIFAVASARLVDGTSPGRFGVGDARTTVTTPFIVRAATPRQLRPGDTAEVRAILQNFGAEDGVARVELALHDDPKTPGQDLAAMSPETAEVAVPAGGQAFVPFRIRADGRGEARLELRATLQVGAAAARDAVKVALPVEPERTLTERVAMYGSTTDDRAIAIPVALPGAIRPDVGGVSVSASSSLLGGLEDAVDSLLTYPYGCVEQTSSRLLPIVALLALHKEYPLGLDADPKAFVREGVERLLSMQTVAGGFAYWPGGQEVHPYASAYATWVLWLADQHGYPVPKEALERAIADLERRIGGVAGEAWSNDMMARAAIGLHVLAEVGRAPRAALDAAFVRRADLPTFGRAFLLMAMHRSDPQRPEVQTLTQELLGNLEELPATAHSIERTVWDWGPYFHSDGRSDAIVLLALLRARPESAVIEKLARGLLERRIGGKWRNTQENAYALVALAEYARVREAEPPDFVGRAWVGRRPVFEASFLGRELTTRSATAAMPEILQPAQAAGERAAPLTVVLQRKGQGRMYYRLGAEWALSDPRPPARAHGLTIERRLRLQDGPLGDRAIAAGDSVAVDLTLSAETRIRYVALDIPIPAGLEAIQLDLGKGQRASKLTGPHGWWVSHQELRRDRVVVFADDLAPGTHRHTVYLRATSRGEFNLPPAHAEAMYMPEVWGRSEGARVAVR